MELFNVYSLYPVEPVRGKAASSTTRQAPNTSTSTAAMPSSRSAMRSPTTYGPLGAGRTAGILFQLGRELAQTTLAEKLGRASGYDDYSLFLCNSGAEANENALKLASFHTGRTKVLAFFKAFHGRTSGAVAATDNPAISAPFNRTANVEFVPLNDIGAARAKLATGEFAAVIIEGIQGVGGIHCPRTTSCANCARRRAKPARSLSSTKYSRATDARVASSPTRLPASAPDLITTAKGMGNGFPIGGVLIAPHFEARPGLLGTTFGGNHLACAAAIAVLDVMEREGLVENAATVGEYLLGELHKTGGLKESAAAD